MNDSYPLYNAAHPRKSWYIRIFLNIKYFFFPKRLSDEAWEYGKPLPDKIIPESLDNFTLGIDKNHDEIVHTALLNISYGRGNILVPVRFRGKKCEYYSSDGEWEILNIKIKTKGGE